MIMPMKQLVTPGPFIKPVKIYDTGTQTVNNGTYTLTIRPPVGEAWRVTSGFGAIVTIVGQDASTKSQVKVVYNDGSAALIAGLVYNSGDTFSSFNRSVTFAGQVLTNDTYLQVIFSNGSAHNNVFEATVTTERL